MRETSDSCYMGMVFAGGPFGGFEKGGKGGLQWLEGRRPPGGEEEGGRNVSIP